MEDAQLGKLSDDTP